MDAFAHRLLAWWNEHGRHNLPWQHPREPWRVWVADMAGSSVYAIEASASKVRASKTARSMRDGRRRMTSGSRSARMHTRLAPKSVRAALHLRQASDAALKGVKAAVYFA